jgi:hypothetical protein
MIKNGASERRKFVRDEVDTELVLDRVERTATLRKSFGFPLVAAIIGSLGRFHGDARRWPNGTRCERAVTACRDGAFY